MCLWLQLCVWESSHEVNVTFTGLATSFAKTWLLISTLTIIFLKYEMLLIKWIFSFPAHKSSLQFRINYKIGFALWCPLFYFRYLYFSIGTLLRKESRLPIHFVILHQFYRTFSFACDTISAVFFPKFKCCIVKMMQFFTGVNNKP